MPGWSSAEGNSNLNPQFYIASVRKPAIINSWTIKKKKLTPAKAAKLYARLAKREATFNLEFNQDLMFGGKVQNRNYGSLAHLTLKKAHEILDHYGYNRKFECPRGVEYKNLYLVLKTFEATLELICKEVFYSPRLRIPLNEVVRNATGGLCADDLAPSVELDIPEPKPRDLLGDDLLESIRSYSEASTTEQGIDFPIPESERIVKLMDPGTVDPTQPSGVTGTKWTSRQLSRLYTKEVKTLDLPEKSEEMTDYQELALVVRWYRYIKESLKAYKGIDILLEMEKANVAIDIIRKLDKLNIDGVYDLSVKEVRKILKEIEDESPLDLISNFIGERVRLKAKQTYPITSEILQYIFEYLYTYMPGFRTAVEEGKSFTHYQTADLKHLVECSAEALKRHLDWGKKWRAGGEPVDFPELSADPRDWEDRRPPSLESKDPDWWGSFQDALAEMGESMAHEVIETFIWWKFKDDPRFLAEELYKQHRDKLRWSDEEGTPVALLDLNEKQLYALFGFLYQGSAHKANLEGPNHQITDAYCWEWGSKGFFFALARMQPWTGGVPVTLTKVIARYLIHPWTETELWPKQESEFDLGAGMTDEEGFRRSKIRDITYKDKWTKSGD